MNLELTKEEAKTLRYVLLILVLHPPKQEQHYLTDNIDKIERVLMKIQALERNETVSAIADNILHGNAWRENQNGKEQFPFNDREDYPVIGGIIKTYAPAPREHIDD